MGTFAEWKTDAPEIKFIGFSELAMCYIVSMLISLRIPDELLAEIDAEALADDRSRNWVLLRRLRGSDVRTRLDSTADVGYKPTGVREDLPEVSDRGALVRRPEDVPIVVQRVADKVHVKSDPVPSYYVPKRFGGK